jgi:hypothetical protein
MRDFMAFGFGLHVSFVAMNPFDEGLRVARSKIQCVSGSSTVPVPAYLHPVAIAETLIFNPPF